MDDAGQQESLRLPWGTQWDLANADDSALDATAVHVTLGFQADRAGGKGPVNRYFGTCALAADGTLALGPFGMTMMAGPPAAMEAERAYLGLLEKVAGFRLADGRLELLDARGASVLTFVPSADPE
ncbi:MAG: META domain-containing protein [Candidatus Nanopelagicales bacterium]